MDLIEQSYNLEGRLYRVYHESHYDFHYDSNNAARLFRLWMRANQRYLRRLLKFAKVICDENRQN